MMTTSLILAISLAPLTNLTSRLPSTVTNLTSKLTRSATNLTSRLPSAVTSFTSKLAHVTNLNADAVHNVMRADPPTLTSFLPNHELLKRQPDTFPFHYFYRKRSLDAYKRVYVAPVDSENLRESSAWAELDEQMAGEFGNDVASLCKFMREAYRQAFESEASGRFSVTDKKNQPDTLVIEPALIAVVPSKAELQAAGIVASSLVFPGFGAMASVVSAGSVVVECRVRDARTNEIVAMYADAEKDPNALIPTARLTWSYAGRINVKAIAGMTVKVLEAEDVTTVRRDFPVRLTALIKDAQIDEPTVQERGRRP